MEKIEEVCMEKNDRLEETLCKEQIEKIFMEKIEKWEEKLEKSLI